MRNYGKKIWCLSCIAFCVLLCTGCSIYKKYDSKRRVKWFTKKLVSKDVDYVEQDMVEDGKVFYFEDSEGRPFAVISYAEYIQLYNSTLPLYTTKVVDTYQVSIFQYEKEEIQKILDETGLDWSELPAFEEETRESDMLKEAKGGYSTHMGINHGTPIEKQDLEMIAKAGAEIDKILHYEYDNEVDTGLAFENQHLSGMRIVFCNDEENSLFRAVEVPFSTSEDSRWTETTLYAHLLESYEEYESETELYREIPKCVVGYMEEKYGTEFVYDQEAGVFGTIGNPVKNEKVEVVLYEKTDREQEFPIRVTVKGAATGEMLTYEEDYQDVLDFKELNRQCQEEWKREE